MARRKQSVDGVFNADTWVIYYYWTNFRKLATKGTDLLDSRTKQAMKANPQKMEQDQIAALINNQKDKMTSQDIEILQKVYNDDKMLEGIYAGIAGSFNQIMTNSKILNTYNEQLNTVRAYGKAFDDWEQTVAVKSGLKIMNEFFDIITTNLQQINALYNEQVSLEPFDELRAIFTGKSRNLPAEASAIYSQKEATEIYNIYKYLYNMSKRLLKIDVENNGVMSEGSYHGSVSNIFNKTIGEIIGEIVIAHCTETLKLQIDDIIVSFAPSQLKSTRTGSLYTDNNNVSKVDWLLTGGEIFRAGLKSLEGNSSMTYLGTLDYNTSIKWHSSIAKNLKIVSGSPLKTVLTSLDSTAQFYSYNFLSFNNNMHHYPKTRKSNDTAIKQAGVEATTKLIAASALNNWLSGSGAKIEAHGQTIGFDKAQFLMVNGKMYSIVTLVNSICNEYLSNNPQYANVLNLDFNGKKNIKNFWNTNPTDEPNYAAARGRSEMTKNLINKLTVEAKMDLKYLEFGSSPRL